jgi:hypothetical protein
MDISQKLQTKNYNIWKMRKPRPIAEREFLTLWQKITVEFPTILFGIFGVQLTHLIISKHSFSPLNHY